MPENQNKNIILYHSPGSFGLCLATSVRKKLEKEGYKVTTQGSYPGTMLPEIFWPDLESHINNTREEFNHILVVGIDPARKIPSPDGDIHEPIELTMYDSIQQLVEEEDILLFHPFYHGSGQNEITALQQTQRKRIQKILPDLNLKDLYDDELFRMAAICSRDFTQLGAQQEVTEQETLWTLGLDVLVRGNLNSINGMLHANPKLHGNLKGENGLMESIWKKIGQFYRPLTPEQEDFVSWEFKQVTKKIEQLYDSFDAERTHYEQYEEHSNKLDSFLSRLFLRIAQRMIEDKKQWGTIETYGSNEKQRLARITLPTRLNDKLSFANVAFNSGMMTHRAGEETGRTNNTPYNFALETSMIGGKKTYFITLAKNWIIMGEKTIQELLQQRELLQQPELKPDRVYPPNLAIFQIDEHDTNRLRIFMSEIIRIFKIEPPTSADDDLNVILIFTAAGKENTSAFIDAVFDRWESANTKEKIVILQILKLVDTEKAETFFRKIISVPHIMQLFWSADMERTSDTDFLLTGMFDAAIHHITSRGMRDMLIVPLQTFIEMRSSQISDDDKNNKIDAILSRTLRSLELEGGTHSAHFLLQLGTWCFEACKKNTAISSQAERIFHATLKVIGHLNVDEYNEDQSFANQLRRLLKHPFMASATPQLRAKTFFTLDKLGDPSALIGYLRESEKKEISKQQQETLEQISEQADHWARENYGPESAHLKHIHRIIDSLAKGGGREFLILQELLNMSEDRLLYFYGPGKCLKADIAEAMQKIYATCVLESENLEQATSFLGYAKEHLYAKQLPSADDKDAQWVLRSLPSVLGSMKENLRGTATAKKWRIVKKSLRKIIGLTYSILRDPAKRGFVTEIIVTLKKFTLQHLEKPQQAEILQRLIRMVVGTGIHDPSHYYAGANGNPNPASISNENRFLQRAAKALHEPLDSQIKGAYPAITRQLEEMHGLYHLKGDDYEIRYSASAQHAWKEYLAEYFHAGNANILVAGLEYRGMAQEIKTTGNSYETLPIEYGKPDYIGVLKKMLQEKKLHEKPFDAMLLSHIDRFTGNRLPLEKMIQAVREISPTTKIIIDDAQGLGRSEMIDIVATDNPPDVILTSTKKACGGGESGPGLLFLKKQAHQGKNITKILGTQNLKSHLIAYAYMCETEAAIFPEGSPEDVAHNILSGAGTWLSGSAEGRYEYQTEIFLQQLKSGKAGTYVIGKPSCGIISLDLGKALQSIDPRNSENFLKDIQEAIPGQVIYSNELIGSSKDATPIIYRISWDPLIHEQELIRRADALNTIFHDAYAREKSPHETRQDRKPPTKKNKQKAQQQKAPMGRQRRSRVRKQGEDETIESIHA